MIAEIEKGALARLKAASDSGLLGYKVATFETYPTDWDEWLKGKPGVFKAPAWFIGFRSWRSVGGNNRRILCSFWLVALAESARPDEEYRRHGDPVDISKNPGSYKLIEDGVSLLQSKSPADEVNAFQIGQCLNVLKPAALKEKPVSMYAAELTCETWLPDPIEADPDAYPFLRTHFDWDVAPYGGIDAAPGTPGIQLPDEAGADASDLVELEQ